jgi:hypothetical protein
MAEPIVRTFVIDTSQAEQNLRSLDASTIATQSSLDALYNQLLKLDEQLNGLEPNSKAFADVNAQIQELESTITNIESGNISNIGTAIESIDASKIEKVGDAIQNIDTGNAARNIENVGDAVQDVVTPVNQLANATENLNTELKDTKVDTSNLDTAATEYKDLAVTQEEVVTSSKSLKAQLRELQAQLAATDPDSAKYRELAAAAGELKDKIQDAAQAVGTQAGGAFERVGGSLGLVTSRIANLDFEGAAEGAKQLAVNISQVKPGDIAKGISSIGSAFASVGKALLTNPIFLIGAAIAAAIVYADELLSLIDGVTDAEQQALEVQKERATLAKEQYDRISATEETLKRQGMTEKEITALKISQLNTAIAQQQAVIETTRIQAEGQIKAAERNAEYLRTFLDFVTYPQKKIAEFFDNFVNGAIGVLNKLGLGLETIDTSKIFDNVNEFITKKIFDPEAERKNQEQIIKDAEKSLETLTNTRDGILNAQEAKEKAAAQKAADDKAKAAKDAADAQLKAEQEVSDLLNQLYQENLKEFEDGEKAKTEAALKEAQKRLDAANAYYTELAQLQDAEYVAGLTNQEKEELAISQKYEKLIALAEAAGLDTTEITKKWQDELAAVTASATATEVATTADSEAKKTEIRQEGFKKGLELAQNAIAIIQAFSDASTKNSERDARKKFKTDKALAIGAATVQTASAVTGALTAGGNPIKLATGAQFVEAALAGALGLAQIIKIKNSQFGSTSGSDSSTNTNVPSTGGGGAETQPAQFNPLAAQFIQNQPEQITPRAFVLAGDVASQQEVREKVEDLARLG